MFPLDMKGCCCHFTKCQMHSFISRYTLLSERRRYGGECLVKNDCLNNLQSSQVRIPGCGVRQRETSVTSQQGRDAEPMLAKRWPSAADVGTPPFWGGSVSSSTPGERWSIGKLSEEFGEKSCKIKKQYLLTWKVSRYCLLALHEEALPCKAKR